MSHPQTQPTYNIDEIVYIAASAARGWLESYRVDGIYFNPSNNKWVYQINIARVPNVPVTVGDHVEFTKQRILYFMESELVDYCTAVNMAKTYHQAELDRLDALSSSTECA